MFSLGNILRDFVSTFLTQPTLILHGATNMTNFELWASEPALVKECCFCFIVWFQKISIPPPWRVTEILRGRGV